MGDSGKSKNSVKWLDLLNDARAVEHKPPGGDWISRKELQRELGFSDGHMSKVITDLVKGGKLESKRFKVWTGSRNYPLSFYRRIK